MFKQRGFAGRSSISAKTTLTVAAATLGVLLPSVLNAALPIFPGPGDPPTGTQYFGPASGIEINDLGVTVGQGLHHTSTSSQYITLIRHGANVTPKELLRSTGTTFPVNTFTFAAGINRAGTAIASYRGVSDGMSRGLRYAPGSTVPEDLQPLTTASNLPNDTSAYDINDAGTVAGFAESSLGNLDLGQRAVIWLPNTTAATQLKSIATGMGRITEVATQINEAGVISGDAIHYKPGVSSGPGVSQGVRPVRWASSTADPVELQLLNARTDDFAEGDVYDMNESGAAVGISHRYSGMTDLGIRAARWNANGPAITELLNPTSFAARYSRSQADSMNNSGSTVGFAYDPASTAPGYDYTDRRAIRWAAGSNVGVELAPLGTTSTGKAYSSAHETNALGHTVGFSATAGDALGQYAAVVWKNNSTTPINLNTLIAPGSGWYFINANDISDTGFVTGNGQVQVPGGSYSKSYTILVPQLGTYGLGDANFDTVVNFDDLVVLAQHYNETNTTLGIHVADFNLDGNVNFDDLVPLAQNYNKSIATGFLTAGSTADTSFAADWALAQSLVPEPATAAACIAPLALGMRRRRRAD